jgi:hypothetical protein
MGWVEDVNDLLWIGGPRNFFVNWVRVNKVFPGGEEHLSNEDMGMVDG